MSNEIDIVVSFDTTGSMYPCLSEVRRKVEEMISTLFSKVPGLRMGIIAHGDYCDHNSPYVTKEHKLTNDQQSVVQFVRSVPPTSGGDGDECYELVLKQVVDFNWQADNKVFVLIGDARPHEPGYKYGQFYVKDDWRFLTRALKERGVKTYVIQCLNNISATSFYKTIADTHGTPKLDLHQFSNIIPVLSALVYKQQGDDQLRQYGDELQNIGMLNRNIANILSQLLDGEKIGAIDYTKVDEDLKSVDPTRFQVLHVDHGCDIMSFVNSTGATFRKGRGFYELTKAELVQERKEVVLQDKVTGDMYSGNKARELLGLPYGMRGKVYPKRDFKYKVFIQSTSSNRKLMPNTMFLYEAKG